MVKHALRARLLAALAAWLLPVNLLAAAVMPITGAPEHACAYSVAAAFLAEGKIQHNTSATKDCEHCRSSATDGSEAHQHLCPHATIVLACAAVPTQAFIQTPRLALAWTPTPMHSVSLDVLTPPPQHC